tara:strand:+ start:239 stop:532 length:294 start_codon:yes stop_codon:yes gene_type:complete
MNFSLKHENKICGNQLGVPLRYSQRLVNAPLPEKESIFKLKKVKNAGLPELIREKDIFQFQKISSVKPKKIIKLNKNDKLAPKKARPNKKTIKMKKY